MEVVAYHQVGIVWGISVHVQEVVVYCQSPNDVVMTVRNWKAAGRSRSTMVRHTQGATSDTFRTSRDGPSEAATLRSCPSEKSTDSRLLFRLDHSRSDYYLWMIWLCTFCTIDQLDVANTVWLVWRLRTTETSWKCQIHKLLTNTRKNVFSN